VSVHLPARPPGPNGFDVPRHWYPLRAEPGLPAARGMPVDPLTGPKAALAGRAVTMDAQFTRLDDAIIYVDQGRIVAVQPRTQPAPAGFAAVSPVETGGTLFPGLIELHNHLSYNALPLWAPVPKRFEHRGQWPNNKDYGRLISGPMGVVGKNPEWVPALVRYVECKCLLAGVTTSQGIRLSSNAGIVKYYRGIVRNVEDTDDAELPEAQSRIPDIEAKDAKRFRAALLKDAGRRCRLLHLSEGLTVPDAPASPARKHFLALEVSATHEWAVTDALAGIHSAGLLPPDFDILAAHKASMVWSPLSNLLLYGGTARVEAAVAAGVRIGLGSDWSPSGSKNLLGELKAAWLYSRHVLGDLFRPRDLAAMATRHAADILKWGHALGSLEAGKRADILVLEGSAGDPYEALLRASERSIRLVMINGVARYGVASVMGALVPRDQTVRVGGESRRLFLRQETANGDVARVALSTAAETLRDAFANLGSGVKRGRPATQHAADGPAWTLALDETEPSDVELRPRLPFSGPRDFTGPVRPAAPADVARAVTLGPIALDPLTVVDDDDYLDQMEAQLNVPEPIRVGLRALY
jgi:5-methylthioadenosine/S-adenosylhomocysteine deaminase